MNNTTQNTYYSPVIKPINIKDMPQYKFAVYFRENGFGKFQRRLCRTKYEAMGVQRNISFAQMHISSTHKNPLTVEEIYLLEDMRDKLKELEIKEPSNFMNFYYKLEKTLGEANASFEEFIQDMIALNIKVPAPILVSTAIEEYLNVLQNSEHAACYKSQNKLILTSFGKMHGDVAVSEITKSHIIKWIEDYKDTSASKRRKPLSDIAVYNAMHLVQVFFNHCAKRQYCQHSPGKDLFMPEVRRQEPKIYSVNTVCEIINHTKPLSLLRLFILISLYGGLRLSEMLKLRWKHISIKYGDIKLDSSMVKTNLRRVVKLPQNLLDALPQYVSLYGHNPEEKVFPFGTQTHNRLNNLFKDIGVKRIRNGLRHTAASFHLAKSKSAMMTAEQLGNSPLILKTHYMGIVSNRECELFFGLDLSKNIVG